MQLKLDESSDTEGANNTSLDLEELTETELDKIKGRYMKLAEKARKDLKEGNFDTGRPEIATDSQ
jgi:hypothetical protein